MPQKKALPENRGPRGCEECTVLSQGSPGRNSVMDAGRYCASSTFLRSFFPFRLTLGHSQDSVGEPTVNL